MIPRPVTWLLVVLSALLVPLGIVSAWTATILDDTDAYVEAVEPLAQDAEVTTVLADELSTAALRAIGAPANGRPQVQTHVRAAAAAAVTSQQFPQVWSTANRVVHREAVKLLSGETLPSGATIEIDLRTLADEVMQELSTRGVRVDLSGTDLTVQLAASEELEQARTWWQVVQTAGYWLPLAAGVLIVITLATARRRLATLGHLAAGVALTLLLTRLALAIAGQVVNERVNEPGGAIWETVTQSLADSLLLGAVIAAVVLAVRVAIGLGRGAARRDR